MFNEEIKMNNEPPKEPHKPPTLLIFGIAMVGGTVLVALGFRTLSVRLPSTIVSRKTKPQCATLSVTFLVLSRSVQRLRKPTTSLFCSTAE